MHYLFHISALIDNVVCVKNGVGHCNKSHSYNSQNNLHFLWPRLTWSKCGKYGQVQKNQKSSSVVVTVVVLAVEIRMQYVFDQFV